MFFVPPVGRFALAATVIVSGWLCSGATAQAATFVQTAHGSATSGTTVSATFSSGATSGAMLIAVVGTRSNVGITGPSGWSTAVNQTGSGGSVSQGIFYKRAIGGETTVSASASSTPGSIGIHIYEYTGVSIYETSASNSGSSTSPSTGSLSTSVANELVLAAMTSRQSTLFSSWTSGYAQRNNFVTSGGGHDTAYGGVDSLSNSAGSKSVSATAANAAWRGQIVSFISDVTSPIIDSVTSTTASGHYKAGQVIPVTVNFSEAVTSTGSVIVTLDTTRSCTFTVSNATSGTCNYTVQAGDTSSDLTASSISGTIKDLAANAMTNFVPTTNLAVSKDIVIDTTAPGIVSTDPVDAAVDVVTDKAPNATFTEGMDPSTITAPGAFTLMNGAIPVSGIVSYVGLSAGFAPDAELLPSTVYTATITTNAKDLAGNPLAAPRTWSFTTETVPVVTPPTVNSTDPADGAINVPSGQVVNVIFSEGMRASTVNSSSFTLAHGATPVSGIVAIVDNHATFTPDSPLSSSTVYTATITTDVKCHDGTNMAAPYVWNFTTADFIAPTLAPVTLVPTPTKITNPSYTFSSDEAGHISYGGACSSVTADAIVGPNTVTFNALSDGLHDDCTITVTDAALNASAPLGVNAFRVDTVRPVIDSVTSTTASGHYKVGQVIPVTVNFSEAVTSTGSVTVTLDTTRSCTFTVSNATSGTCNYTVQAGDTSSGLTVSSVSGAIADTATNSMTDFVPLLNLTDSKTIVIDTTAPGIVSTDPADAAVDVVTDKAPNATFTEEMDSSTITAPGAFTLMNGAIPVSGIVSYVGLSAGFAPDAELLPSTVYTATITTNAKDLAGNPLAAPRTWSFTTSAAPDITPPSITSVDPVDAAVNVPTDKVVGVLFDESMSVATLTAPGTFTLAKGATSVAGVVAAVGNHATFTPNAALLPNTVYTATVTTAAKDLANNPIAAPRSWSFTTSEGPLGSGPATVGSSADLALMVQVSPETLPAGGGEVTFTYTVKNLGDRSHIGNIVVKDDQGTDSCAPITLKTGDIDTDTSLDSGESWTFRCVKTITKSVTHTAVATGFWNSGTGTSNVSTVPVLVGEVKSAPVIRLKVVPLPSVLHVGGETVAFKYEVSNIGDSVVSDIAFSQSACHLSGLLKGDMNGNGLLDPGETWTYSCSEFISVAEERSIVVTGSAAGVPVSDSTTVSIAISTPSIQPHIHLFAKANPAHLPFGGGTTYLSFEVQNDDSLPLSDIRLTSGSDTCEAPTFEGGDTNKDGLLQPGETWTYTCIEHLTKTEVDAPFVRGQFGTVWATDESILITPVAESAPPVVDPTAKGPYDPEIAQGATPDIDTELGLVATAHVGGCMAGVTYKLPNDGNPATQEDTTVYYCGRDGALHVFPNTKIFLSWYPDFSNVKIIAKSEFVRLTIGAEVRYRPGVFLIKKMSDSHVYVLSRGGVLRLIANEAQAVALYGVSWMSYVHDLPDIFWANYTIGDPLP